MTGLGCSGGETMEGAFLIEIPGDLDVFHCFIEAIPQLLTCSLGQGAYGQLASRGNIEASGKQKKQTILILNEVFKHTFALTDLAVTE